jgi:predicted short-subunit dehydrogenase-like oxidoreductase (DUF2520 family)
MRSLSIIGCGSVGCVIGKLFHEAGLFEIRDILNRTPESAAKAAAFIGAGRAVSGFDDMTSADCWLIAASDDAIVACAEGLASSGVIQPGNVVCHFSGALSSTVLSPLRERGAMVASVHPVRSFADPAASVAEFSGTWCGIEGDAAAVDMLSEAFSSIRGRIFPLDPAFKTLYHAGSVMVCNYLTALMEVGLQVYGKGGLPRETALQVMEPLVRGTLDNIFRVGTEQSLTGPIARGDAAVVSRQLAAIEQWDGEIALIYRGLGRVALELARRRSGSSAGYEEIEVILSDSADLRR